MKSSAEGQGPAIRPLAGPLDALRMRAVRNAVRANMTRDVRHIGVVRQLRWWWTRYRRWAREDAFRAWLVWQAGRCVGYGIVRAEGSRWWVTGGLLPEARGKGLGQALFRFLTIEAAARSEALGDPTEAWLEVLADNAPAVRLYERLGYRVWAANFFRGANEGERQITVMVWRQEPSAKSANPRGDA